MADSMAGFSINTSGRKRQGLGVGTEFKLSGKPIVDEVHHPNEVMGHQDEAASPFMDIRKFLKGMHPDV